MIDRILDLIDTGLQHTHEPAMPLAPAGRCARCEHHQPADGGDLCDGCRAFLLGDSDTDPKAWDGRCHLAFDLGGPPAPVVVGTCQCGVFAAVRQQGSTQLGIRISAAFEQYVDALNRTAEAVQSLHIAIDPQAIRREQVRQRERTLLDQHRRGHRRTNRWGRP